MSKCESIDRGVFHHHDGPMSFFGVKKKRFCVSCSNSFLNHFCIASRRDNHMVVDLKPQKPNHDGDGVGLDRMQQMQKRNCTSPLHFSRNCNFACGNLTNTWKGLFLLFLFFAYFLSLIGHSWRGQIEALSWGKQSRTERREIAIWPRPMKQTGWRGREGKRPNNQSINFSFLCYVFISFREASHFTSILCCTFFSLLCLRLLLSTVPESSSSSTSHHDVAPNNTEQTSE